METLLRQLEACCECDDAVTLPSGYLTIGQAAHGTGLTAKAIRYYEGIGLLPRAARGDNRYRRYTPADVGIVSNAQPLHSRRFAWRTRRPPAA